MILYDQEDTVSLDTFGILIPVHFSKAGTTLQTLRNHPLLGPREGEWLMPSREGGISQEDVLRAHTPEYVRRLFEQNTEAEIISTYELIAADGSYHRYDPERARGPLRGVLDRALARVSGTYQCCEHALDTGFCFYLGGGMHHAHPDQGKGFCLVNDIVISLRRLQAEGRIQRAWVIDVDAHKGDGTAAMTREDPSIVTLSVHMAEGWPLDEDKVLPDGSPNPSFVPSDLDIPIGSGQEAKYQRALLDGLRHLEKYPRPDLALVVQGADPFELDELQSTARIKLTLDQLLKRDQSIFTFLQERNIPQACLMAGGYGRETWRVYTQFLEWALLS